MDGTGWSVAAPAHDRPGRGAAREGTRMDGGREGAAAAEGGANAAQGSAEQASEAPACRAVGDLGARGDDGVLPARSSSLRTRRL
eukprot:scaffold1006_cov408-Prasinococcus_capsulatus_cf.AAC.1